MRISYFHYLYASPGPLVQVNEFAKAFRSLGHELRVHGMDEKPSTSRSQQVKEGAKRILGRYVHEFNTLRKNWLDYLRECSLLKEEKPDVVLCRYKLYRLAPAWAACRFSLPYVLWIDAPGTYEQRHYLKEFVQLPGLAEFVERVHIGKSDRSVLVSDEIKRHLFLPLGRNGKFTTITNGVDPEKFSPQVPGKGIRKKFPMKDAVVFGFVGSFSPWHGMESLKNLMEGALNLDVRVCFLLVGDGSRRQDLEGFLQSGKWDPRRVLFTGQIPHDEVSHYVSEMDVCLLPYDQTGEEFYFSPLKLFEYMACAKPILASPLGQIRKILRDGENGLFYSTQDRKALRVPLKRLIEEEVFRRRLGEAARQTVLERYTWHHTALAFEKLFLEVLERKKKTT